MEKEQKAELYEKALVEIKDRLSTLEKGIIIPRMATVTAVLKNLMPHYFWCGFYFCEEDELVVGPYQGTSACPNIAYSGVCGKSAQEKTPVIVPDVHAHPGHIECDPRSNAEIVIPLRDKEGRVIAVFDVDSTEKDAFDDVDREHLEKIMPILLEGDD